MQNNALRRGCVELAYRVAFGYGLDDEVYVFADLRTVAAKDQLSSVAGDTPLLVLASAIEAKVGSGQAVDTSNDLLGREVGQVLAQNVDDHLDTISVGEWQYVTARAAFYESDINARAIPAETDNAGDS